MTKKLYDPFRGGAQVEIGEYTEITEPVTTTLERHEIDLTQDSDENAVPVGTTREMLAWVDGDVEKAKRALEVEEAKGDAGLKGLKRELQKLIAEA